MAERNNQNRIRLALSNAGIINFRNNVGMGWAGQVIKPIRPTSITVIPGDVVIRKARPLHAGLFKGSADVIGIKPVLITPDMVGQVIGQFVSVEVKTPTGRRKADQTNWAKMINDNGGIGIFAVDERDLIGIVDINPDRPAE